MASDAVSAIMQDHRRMERLFERCRTDKANRAELVAEIKARLKAHSVAEEERVYPALAKANPAEKEDVHHGVEEHREAEELMERLEGTDPSSKEFDKALKEFVDAVKHHVEEEESDILPNLEDAVDPEKLEKLGAEFDRRRIEVLDEMGVADTGAPDDLSSMTRAELYEEAKKADVPGRSQMTKDELAEALGN
jgi:hemerythrin-like domain-containing protein